MVHGHVRTNCGITQCTKVIFCNIFKTSNCAQCSHALKCGTLPPQVREHNPAARLSPWPAEHVETSESALQCFQHCLLIQKHQLLANKTIVECQNSISGSPGWIGSRCGLPEVTVRSRQQSTTIAPTGGNGERSHGPSVKSAYSSRYLNGCSCQIKHF